MTSETNNTVNNVNELVLIPSNIIPIVTSRPSTRLHYKDTVTQRRYCIKIDNNVFSARQYLNEFKAFSSRNFNRKNESTQDLINALSDFKQYVLKHRQQYLRMMDRNFGNAVSARDHALANKR